MAAAPSELDAHLGFWLRLVSNHVSHAFAAKTATKGVTVAEWVILRTVYGHGAMAPSDVAARLNMTRGAISKLGDRLIRKSLLSRAASVEDGRAHTLSLTPQGRKLVPQLAALADRNDAEFFGGLTSAERKAIENILRALAAHSGMTSIPVE